LDRLLLLLAPDAAFVVGGEEVGVDVDVGEEAVRTVEANVVLVPAVESTRMLDVAAGVCVGGGEARVV
jgi:tRNA(Leu) C34 or U34 (ribose-2'-O)-methylase TrmL